MTYQLSLKSYVDDSQLYLYFPVRQADQTAAQLNADLQDDYRLVLHV